MTVQTSDEQRDQIWSRADDEGIDVTRTVDYWGDEITIFQGWHDVEKLAEIIYTTLDQQYINDTAPSWEHLEESRRPNPHRCIEWAIGEFSFDDEYTTCSQCYSAIDMHDAHPLYGSNLDLGEIYCANCLRTNKGDSALAYLDYCARHLEDNREIVRTFVDPSDHGYIPINLESSYGDYHYGDALIKYEGITNFPLEDHPEFRSGYYGLLYANHDQLGKIAKAARLVDSNFRLIAQYSPYGHSSYIYWAKFEDEPHDSDEDKAANYQILQYVIGLVLRKFEALKG